MRGRLLQGMLGADLVGFHTPAYLRHFATSLTDILGYSRRDRPGAALRPRGAPRRLSHGHRRGDVRRAGRRSGGRGRGRGHPGRRQRADPRRRRPARLHQGHPPPAARLRADAADAPGPAGEGAAGAGGGAVAHQRRRLPGLPRRWWTGWSAASTARSGRRAGCRCTTSSAGCPRPTWWRSTARPT